MISTNPVNVPSASDQSAFMKHRWVKPLIDRYDRDARRAARALEQLYSDLEGLNETYYKRQERTLFTTLEARVKGKVSTFKRLFERYQLKRAKEGCSPDNLSRWYGEIHDLAGLRFSCPYFDEIVPAIRDQIRPWLADCGYGVDLTDQGHEDKDLLDTGDRQGYRAYHFFVSVPTPVDIYGSIEHMKVEVQARSELQHVWAVKSHDLLYKPKTGWEKPGGDLLQDMQELSNSLRTVDHFLVSVRNKVKGKP